MNLFKKTLFFLKIKPKVKKILDQCDQHLKSDNKDDSIYLLTTNLNQNDLISLARELYHSLDFYFILQKDNPEYYDIKIKTERIEESYYYWKTLSEGSEMIPCLISDFPIRYKDGYSMVYPENNDVFKVFSIIVKRCTGGKHNYYIRIVLR